MIKKKYRHHTIIPLYHYINFKKQISEFDQMDITDLEDNKFIIQSNNSLFLDVGSILTFYDQTVYVKQNVSLISERIDKYYVDNGQHLHTFEPYYRTKNCLLYPNNTWRLSFVLLKNSTSLQTINFGGNILAGKRLTDND